MPVSALIIKTSKKDSIVLKEKRITITGAKGFLGGHLLKKFVSSGCRNISIADLPDYNLTNINDIRKMYDET
jgi:GDP-L-fucose synthase